MRRPKSLLAICWGLLCLSACSKQVPTGPVADLITDYEFSKAWGDSGSGNGQFYRPQGVAVDVSGNVYVVDTWNSRIQKFTGDGTYLTQWGTWGTGVGQFRYMNSIAVDGSGNVYVADTWNYRIQKFTSDGTYLAQWAIPGLLEPDGFLYGIAVDQSGAVYVSDSGNSRILKFAGDGTFVMQWGELGHENGQFVDPWGVATDAHGHVYVADGRWSIQEFTTDGAFLKRWDMRSADHYGSERVTADANGSVFVTDYYSHNIKKYNSAGWLLTQWAPQTDWRWTPAVAVAPDGSVYLTDTDQHRIEKYAPVRR